MSAESLGQGFFMPEAAVTPPDYSAAYDLLQKRALYYLEHLLVEICERGDRDTFQKLIEIFEDLAGHSLWCLAEPGRTFELLKDRSPMPGD